MRVIPESHNLRFATQSSEDSSRISGQRMETRGPKAHCIARR